MGLSLRVGLWSESNHSYSDRWRDWKSEAVVEDQDGAGGDVWQQESDSN